MKKIAKRIAAAGLVLMMAFGALTGCNQQASDQSETLLFTYDGREVYLDEAWTYAKIAQATYENAYASMFGDEMWTMQVSVDEEGNPVDFQQMVKGSIISQIKQVIILVNKAEEFGVSLTADEKSDAKEAAELFCDKAEGKAILEECGADKALIEKIYMENALASKVQKEAVKDVDKNVSEDEARQTSVFKLVFGLSKTDDEGKTVAMTDAEKAEQLAKAEDALAQIQAGSATIEKLAETLSLTATAKETYGAGEALAGEEFETVMASLKDGDVEKPGDDVYKDSYFISAKSKSKPQVVDKFLNVIKDKKEVYSGCYGRASMSFYPYNYKNNKGIACYLGNVQKLEDGERLGHAVNATDEFEAYDVELF